MQLWVQAMGQLLAASIHQVNKCDPFRKPSLCREGFYFSVPIKINGIKNVLQFKNSCAIQVDVAIILLTKWEKCYVLSLKRKEY